MLGNEKNENSIDHGDYALHAACSTEAPGQRKETNEKGSLKLVFPFQR